MKIFHGPIPVVGLPWTLSRAQRKLGHSSDYVIFDTAGSEWLLEGWDRNLELGKRLISGSYGINSAFRHLKVARLFLDCIRSYDAFHFYSGRSLFPGKQYAPCLPRFKDLPVLRSLGRRIIFHHIGCNDSSLKANLSRNDPSICEVCRTGIDGLCNDEEKAVQSLMERKYGHVIITSIPDMSDFNRWAVYVPAPVDLDVWTANESARNSESGGINVVQVTGNIETRGDIKGVKYTAQAVEKLRKEGHNINLSFIDRAPTRRMPSILAKADVVVDNLLYGWFGLTGIQAMALEKPVIAYLRRPWLQFHCEHFSRPPIIESNPKNIYEILKEITSKVDLQELGSRCRRYVEETHDSLRIGKRLIDLYSSS